MNIIVYSLKKESVIMRAKLINKSKVKQKNIKYRR